MKHEMTLHEENNYVVIRLAETIGADDVETLSSLSVEYADSGHARKMVLDNSAASIDVMISHCREYVERMCAVIGDSSLCVALVHSTDERNRRFTRGLKNLFDISYLDKKSDIICGVFPCIDDAKAWICAPCVCI